MGRLRVPGCGGGGSATLWLPALLLLLLLTVGVLVGTFALFYHVSHVSPERGRSSSLSCRGCKLRIPAPTRPPILECARSPSL